MYQNCCKKCGSISLHTEVKGSNTGLYCDDCGAWVKWLGKDELNAFEHSKKNQVLVQMRDSTPEENQAISEYIKSISVPTGINIFDEKSIVKRLEEFVEFLEKTQNMISCHCLQRTQLEKIHTVWRWNVTREQFKIF